MFSYDNCTFCPRNCGIDRFVNTGYCGCGKDVVISKIMLHHWEEPVISGKNGSGAIFFSGCNLKCEFCQNKNISFSVVGKKYSAKELGEEMLLLQERGAHNINLVTATPYLKSVLDALEKIKYKLKIPVVYNCGGYETINAVKELSNYVDVFLPDLKYYSSDLSSKYSKAKDYNEVAFSAICEMIKNKPNIIIEDGLIKKGVIIRHLVLPGNAEDSINVIKQISSIKEGEFLLSLMSQFTPDFTNCKELKRRVTTYEYNKVLNEVLKLGLNGFFQERESATASFTPDFK